MDTKINIGELALRYGWITSERNSVAAFTNQEKRIESIAFAEWISNHKLDFQPAQNGMWIGLDLNMISSETLYQLYIQSIK